MTGPEVRVAMWSGPRNISTAMMRAWENRPDTVVVDEPLYATYLARTGIDHPGRDEVLAAQPTSLGEVVTLDLATGEQVVRTEHGAPLADIEWFQRDSREFHISDGTVVQDGGRFVV